MSLTTNIADRPQPRRGEIWWVNFDPTIGAEIRKSRPAVVVSSDAIGKLPVKLVAPVTDWKDWYATQHWLVELTPDPLNGLAKHSAVDTLQLRGVDLQRFDSRLGRLSSDTLDEVIAAIAIVIEYS
jgi:mRNA interferase MazF